MVNMGMVSVIIPAYNQEKYIDECISSVTQQTYENWEIIVIDDGSTDNTYHKVSSWAKADGRIKVFKQENQGSGLARNNGMKEARGEYISFLDSDDFWRDKDVLEKIMQAVAGVSCDVIGTFYSNCMEGKFVALPRHRKYFSSGEETGKWISFAEEQDCFGFCSYLYRREFLVENEFVFPDYLVEQDPPFLAKVLECVQEYYVVPVEFATIRHRPRKRFTSQRRINDCIRGVIDVIDVAQRGNLDKLLYEMTDYVDGNSGVFVKSILDGNTELLQLMLKLQEKVIDKKIENKTIQFMRHSMKTEIERRMDAFLTTVEGAARLIIYGAGNHGKLFLENMLRLDIQQEIVFAETKEPRNRIVCGKKCYKLEELISCKEEAIVIVAVKNRKIQNEMMLYLQSLGFQNYILDDYNLEIALESGIIEKKG